MYLVLLAAGRSKRIGKDKAFLIYKGKSFLKGIIEKISDKVEKIIIVAGTNNYKQIKEIFKENKDIHIIKNTKHHLGQIYSVKLAIRYIKKNLKEDDIILHLVDQPHIKRSTYLKMIRFFKSKQEVVIPTFFIKKQNKLKRGHPIIIPKRYLKLILKNPSHLGLHWFIHHEKVKKYNLVVDDKAVVEDIDTIEDYEKLMK